MGKKYTIPVCLLIIVIILTVILGFSRKAETGLFSVNGELITKEDYDRVKDNYDYTDYEILEGLILETLVLQQSEEFGIKADYAYIKDLAVQSQEMEEIYKKAIETYGSVKAYEKALENRYKYEEVKKNVIADYVNILHFSDSVLQDGVNRYIEENNLQKNDFTEEEIIQIKESLVENYKTLAGNLYFIAWSYHLVDDAKIDAIEYNGSPLFQERYYDINKQEVIIGENKYPLSETTIYDANRRFAGEINFFSDKIGEEYEFTNLKESPYDFSSIKVLQMTLDKKDSKESMGCDIVVNPIGYKNEKRKGDGIGYVNGLEIMKDDEKNEYYLYDDSLCIVYRFYDVQMKEGAMINLIKDLIRYEKCDIPQ